jgi:hypothetical protein
VALGAVAREMARVAMRKDILIDLEVVGLRFGWLDGSEEVCVSSGLEAQ